MHSAVNDGLVNKVGRAVEILMAEHGMPLPATNFLCLLDRLDILLRSDEALQTVRLKVEKSLLETMMREDLTCREGTPLSINKKKLVDIKVVGFKGSTS